MNEEQKQPGGQQQPQPQGIKPVLVHVAGLLTDDATENPVIVLKSHENERVLLMWIGDAEAQAIDFALQKVGTNRPLTHQLFINAVGAMGGTLTHVVIDRLKQGTYYASLFVRTKESVHIIDARPSDAIALALHNGCQLLVERTLFEKASTTLHVQDAAKVEPHKIFEINIQLSPAARPLSIDAQEESKTASELHALLPRKQQKLDKHELSPTDVERIKKQLSIARSREENP